MSDRKYTKDRSDRWVKMLGHLNVIQDYVIEITKIMNIEGQEIIQDMLDNDDLSEEERKIANEKLAVLKAQIEHQRRSS